MALTQTLIDLILILVIAEFLALWIYLIRAGKTNLVPALGSFLLSGALLLIALRFTLAQSVSSEMVLGMLGLSFPVHVATIILAWRALLQGKHSS